MSKDKTLGFTTEQLRRAGFHFGWGVIQAICLLIFLGWILAKVLNPLVPVGDCDKSAYERCGMKVVTDHKTGKQYLLSPYGGIIERER